MRQGSRRKSEGGWKINGCKRGRHMPGRGPMEGPHPSLQWRSGARVRRPYTLEAGRQELLTADGAAVRVGCEPRRDQPATVANLTRREHAVAICVRTIELSVAFRIVSSETAGWNIPIRQLRARGQCQAYRQNREKWIDDALVHIASFPECADMVPRVPTHNCLATGQFLRRGETHGHVKTTCAAHGGAHARPPQRIRSACARWRAEQGALPRCRGWPWL